VRRGGRSVRRGKLVITALVVLVAALALVACGGDEEPAAEESPATEEPAGPSGEISVWIMDPGNPQLQDVIETYASDFEAQNPGTTVNVEFVPWDGGKDRFLNAIASGDVPDLAETGTTWTPEFAELGGLEPMSEENEDWLPSLVDAGSVDDTLYGVPWYAGNRALIYRVDIFEELGLEPPETWDDLEAVADEIKAEKPNVFPIIVPGDYIHMLLPMVWQAGGDIATQEGDSWTAAIDSEEGKQAFETFARWHEQYSPRETLNQNEADARVPFDNGRAAMFIGGPWDVTAAKEANPELEDKLATALIPEGPGGNRDTFAGGSHLSIFADSDNKELAAAFRDFMLQPAELTKFTDQLGFFAGTVSGINESALLEDPIMEPFGVQLRDHSRVYPVTPKWGALETDPKPSTVALQSIVQGTSPDEALGQLAQEVEEALNG
jgi:N,N'-diacetylchitobiose transport system substrate-binding protein